MEVLNFEIETTEGITSIVTTDVSPINLLLNQDVLQTYTSEDIEVTDYTHGLILTSPNGTRFRLTVNNDGSVTSTSL